MYSTVHLGELPCGIVKGQHQGFMRDHARTRAYSAASFPQSKVRTSEHASAVDIHTDSHRQSVGGRHAGELMDAVVRHLAFTRAISDLTAARAALLTTFHALRVRAGAFRLEPLCQFV